MVESFNFGGSREIAKPFENLKNQRAIVQAYCNSDRCSFTHPELAYWDRVPEELINKIATYYYNNHPHMKYLLFMYALMVRRCDLDFAKQEVGLDSSNSCFLAMQKGKAALITILDQLGLGNSSTPMNAIWKQHLGCSLQSMKTETNQKFKTFMTLNKLQLYQAKKIVKHGILETDGQANQRKLRLLQATLANLTSFTGKG
ncbi:unnamed protein product [Paramecium sonneborni]|nr:unnamed protein product [Paramecium sonneborni]